MVERSELKLRYFCDSLNYLVKNARRGRILLLSQRESFVTVKFFDSEISMITSISELPESKYAFSGKCLCVCMYVCVYVCMCVYVCVL